MRFLRVGGRRHLSRTQRSGSRAVRANRHAVQRVEYSMEVWAPGQVDVGAGSDLLPEVQVRWDTFKDKHGLNPYLWITPSQLMLVLKHLSEA